MIAGRPAGRWAAIVSEGSTAITSMSSGSYEPAPAPTLTTERASPSASLIRCGDRRLGPPWCGA